MSSLSDLRYAPPLTSDEVDFDADMVPVWHPGGGVNTDRSLSLANLRTAVAATSGGSGSERFFYKADAQSTSQSDPGTGKMRWNNSDQLAATVLVFDWITANGFDPVALFMKTKVGATFTVQDADFSLNHQVWKMLAPATNMPDWFWVSVELVSSGGSPQMKHNAQVAVLLELGDKIVSSAGQVIHNSAGDLVGSDNLLFDGNTLRMPAIPTSPVGLQSGSLWNNAGVLNVVS